MLIRVFVIFRFFKKPNRCFTKGSTLPHIFSIYVNDFEMDFLTNNNVPIQLLESNLFLFTKTNEMYLNTKAMLSLFDTYVGSVLNYGCEIWGFRNGKDVEKLENFIKCKKKPYKFCSCLL